MDPKKLSSGNRIGAMLIDLFIFNLLLFFIYIPVLIIFSHSKPNLATGPDYQFLINFFKGILVFLTVLMLNKDIFAGKSPAKLLLRMQVLHHKSGKVASPLRCMLRNLTFFIWPVEVFFVISRSDRRLGDLLAGTRLAVYEPGREREASVTWSGFKAAGLAVIVSLLLIIAIPSLVRNVIGISPFYGQSEARHIIKSKDLARELELELQKKLEVYTDKVDVSVMGDRNSKAIKEVAVGFMNRDSLLTISDEVNLKFIENTVLAAVSEKLGDQPFIIKVNIVARISGNPFSLNIFKALPVFVVQTGLDYTYAPKGRKWYRQISGHYQGARIFRQYHPGGVLAKEVVYNEGMHCGIYHEWYLTGRLRKEENYVNGMREGYVVTWHTNGVKSSVEIYREDMYVKQIGRWNKKGKKLRLL